MTGQQSIKKPEASLHDEIIDELRALRLQKTTERFWDMAFKSMIPILSGVTIWGIFLEVRVSILESRQFTVNDAQMLENRIGSNVMPAPYVKEAVTEIKQTMTRMEDRVRKIEENLRK